MQGPRVKDSGLLDSLISRWFPFVSAEKVRKRRFYYVFVEMKRTKGNTLYTEYEFSDFSEKMQKIRRNGNTLLAKLEFDLMQASVQKAFENICQVNLEV